MTFYDRYINGEDGRAVYAEIYALGQEALQPAYYEDVQKTLKETFHRVAYNLPIIYTELTAINYAFKQDFNYHFERPLSKPLPNTPILLAKVAKSIRSFGYIPLSLQLFYEIVGSCNFGWDYDTVPDLLWGCADPIQIVSLDEVAAMVADPDWKEEMKEMLDDDETQRPYIELAADYLHKDNISGGPAYSIEITPSPSIDSLLLEEEHQTTFIDYLRICMENGGFSKITQTEYQNDYASYFSKVLPQLKRI